MDFLSIRKKAKERAEARAREQAGVHPAAAAVEPPATPAAAPAPAPPAPGPPAPEPGRPRLEEALRVELTRLAEEQRPPSDPALPPPPPPAEAAAPDAATGAPTDPLDEFFWSPDEPSPDLPELGLGHAARGALAGQGEARREYVTFLLGSEEYGVEVERVREILKSPPITEVPRAPDHVLGVVTVRGEVIAVIDPRRRLELPPRAPGKVPRIVVCDSAQGPAGLLVDAVSQVARLLPSAIEPRPATLAGAGGEAIAGIGRERDRLIILLDLDQLLRAPGTSGESAA